VTNNGPSPHGTGRNQFPYFWLWILLPGIALLWPPLRQCVPVWFGPGSQVVYQAFVPFVVIWLCWSRRTDWQRTQQELATLFPDPRDPRRSGNLSLVILGGVILLLGVLASLSSLSVFGLCLLIFGAVFAVAGPFLLRVILLPLLGLLLMIPFPSSLIQGIVIKYQLTGAAMLGGALELLGTKNRVLGPEVTLQASGHSLFVTPSLSGVGTFFFAIMGTLAYLLWKRSAFGRGLVALVIASFISCLVSLLRLLILGQVVNSNPALADIFQKVPALPAIVSVWGLTWFFTRKLLSPRRKIQLEVDA
jgi:Transmembrane exosortase (Exosortase_EpsH)